MPTDRMQHQRFEHKYMLDEVQAQSIRQLVVAKLEVDENGVGKPNLSYPVHSLYLDSPQLETFWSTINGDRNRFKLRLRFYNNEPNSPVFFEIKRRVDKCILKQRAGVRKSAVARLLNGHLPSPPDLISYNGKSIAAILHFLKLVEKLQAVPQAHVCYLREAYVDPMADNVRVTFDRKVTEPRREPLFSTTMKDPSRPFGNRVILELKFTDRFPAWMRELIERFDLMQCGAAKYCEGIAGLPSFAVSHAGDFREAPRRHGQINPDRELVAQAFAY